MWRPTPVPTRGPKHCPEHFSGIQEVSEIDLSPLLLSAPENVVIIPHLSAYLPKGLYGPITGKEFLLFPSYVKVPNRSCDTLLALVEHWIAPGTGIIWDGWAAYAGIPLLDRGVYAQSVIHHQENFVDPDNASVTCGTSKTCVIRQKRRS